MHKREPIPNKIRLAVLNRDKSTCQLCGAKAPDVVIHIDHILPVSKGGKNNVENLQCLCKTCNLSKYNKVELHINTVEGAPTRSESDEWLRVVDIAKITLISAGTIRFYIDAFEELFPHKEYGRRFKKYHVSSIQTLKTIRTLFGRGLTRDEVGDYFNDMLSKYEVK